MTARVLLASHVRDVARDVLHSHVAVSGQRLHSAPSGIRVHASHYAGNGHVHTSIVASVVSRRSTFDMSCF